MQPQLTPKIQVFADGCAEYMEVPPSEPQSWTAVMNLEYISQNNPYLCPVWTQPSQDERMCPLLLQNRVLVNALRGYLEG